MLSLLCFLLPCVFDAILLKPYVQGRVADFEMKLMEIEQEQLGIPENDYSAQVWCRTKGGCMR